MFGIFLSPSTPKPTVRQTNKQMTDRWSGRQVNIRIDGQANKWRHKQMTNRQADSRADWQSGWQPGRFPAERYWLERVAGRQTGRWTGRQPCTQTDRTEDWRNNRWRDRQKTDRHAERQAERLPDRHAPLVAGQAVGVGRRHGDSKCLWQREGEREGWGQCTPGWLTVDLWHWAGRRGSSGSEQLHTARHPSLHPSIPQLG